MNFHTNGKVCLMLFACLATWTAVAQQNPAAPPTAVSSAVPSLINYSGTLADANGKALSGVSGVTFLLYKEPQGGSPLWMETQNVTPDRNGRYTVTLGTTTNSGLPANAFVSGEARWLAVQVVGQQEQPRVLLVAVPYALKAGDAQTIGGLPPSAFVLAAPASGINGGSAVEGASPSRSTSMSVPPPISNVTTAGGTVNIVPLWSTATDIENSVITQTGSGATAKIGIGTTAPGSTLDVTGTATVRGVLTLPAKGTATTTKGFNSQPLSLVASAFNSSSAKAVNEYFNWQSEPAGNNTSTPSATLNLLFGAAGSVPTETGLKVASNGRITFAAGQTFPGTGTGTITGVTPGTDLVGGGTSGVVSLGLDTTQVPQLIASNNFVGNQTITGNLSETGILTGNTANFTSNNPAQVIGATQQGTGNGIVGAVVSSNGGYGVVGTGPGGVQGTATLCCHFGGFFQGFSVTDGSLQDGTPAVVANGGSASGASITVFAADGVDAAGGNESSGSSGGAGNGVTAQGGSSPRYGGIGIVGVGGGGDSQADDGLGGWFEAGASSDGEGSGILVSGGIGTEIFAGEFNGDVTISGTLSSGVKDFKIDHPLDPANKYLVHASVESSEMKNIYDGVVTTDLQGHATVTLPEWFEVLNTDFRYQLTVIGQFAQAIVSREIENHQFEIATNAANVKVSWQVTGVRHDAFAKAHPLVVEEEKTARVRGYYIHPELYGAPQEKRIEWARHPHAMRLAAKRQGRVSAFHGSTGESKPTAAQ